MCLILQGTRFKVQVLKPCIYQDLKGEAQQIISTVVSIENFENQYLRSVFHAYPSHVFRFSFLTTLDIYKDYFKGRLTWCNLMQRFYASILWPKTYALVHFSLKKAAAFVCRRVLWPRSFLIFIVWMNWRTLQLTSISSSCVSHVLGSVHQLVSPVLGAVHWKERFLLYYKYNCVLG